MEEIKSGDLSINEYVLLRQVESEGDFSEAELYKISYKGTLTLVKRGILRKSTQNGKYSIPAEHKHLIQDVRNKLGINKI